MDDPSRDRAIEVYQPPPQHLQRPHRHATVVARNTTHDAGRFAGRTARGVAHSLYRNRVPLLPYYAFVALLALAVLHRTTAGDDPGRQAMSVYGPGVLVGLVAVYVALRLPRAQDGTGPSASTMIAGAGLLGAITLGYMWLIVATGPSVGMVIVGVLLTTFGALPYWQMLYRAAHPQHTVVNLPAEYVPTTTVQQEDPGPFASIPGMAGSEWMGPRTDTDSGWMGVLQLPPGKDARRIAEKRAGEFAAVLQVGADSIELLEDRGSNDRLIVYVHTVDKLEHAYMWPQAQAMTTDLLDGVPIGIQRTGQDAILNLTERHFLVAGEPGAGKSNVQAMLTAAAALDPRVDLYLLDGKRTELVAWKDRATAYVDDDPDAAVDVARLVEQRTNETYDRMADEHRRIFDPNRDGIIVVDIDELAGYLIDGSTAADEFGRILMTLGNKGRAAGLILLAATQRPSGRQFGKWASDLRAVFTYRMCLRVPDYQAAHMVLGKWDGVDPHKLPIGRRGMAYLAAEDGRPRLIRSYLLPDEDLHQLAETAAEIGPAPQLTAPPATSSAPGVTVTTVTPLPIPRFPTGEPITDDRERALWAALDDQQPRTVRDLLAFPGGCGYGSRQGVNDALDRLAAAGHVHVHEDGRARRYTRTTVRAREA